jgi:hypothetical protein
MSTHRQSLRRSSTIRMILVADVAEETTDPSTTPFLPLGAKCRWKLNFGRAKRLTFGKIMVSDSMLLLLLLK